MGNTVINSWSSTKGTKIKCVLPRDEEFESKKERLLRRLARARSKSNSTEPESMDELARRVEPRNKDSYLFVSDELTWDSAKEI